MSSLSLGRTPRRRCLIGITVAALVATTVPVAIATPPECQTRWLDGVPTSDISYSGSYFSGVRALTMWDPDGDGPEPERLVAGGAFDTIGGIGSPQVAAWEPGDRSFRALGSGFAGFNPFGPLVSAVASAPNSDGGNDLYVAGNIASYGGVPVNGIARWDGMSWGPLGEGLSSFFGTGYNPVSSMITCGDGKLVVVGSFLRAGGLPAPGLAVWDGSAWSVPVTFASGNVNAVACLPDNSLIIGGSFTSVNGEPIVRVARIHGGIVTPVSGEQIGNVTSLAVTFNGTVFATSVTPSGTQVVQYADGSWAQIGAVASTASSNPGAPKVLALADNSIALFGTFTAIDGVPMSHLARYNGASWEPLGPPESPYAAAQLPDGRIVTARTQLGVTTPSQTMPLLGVVPQLTNDTAYATEYFEGDLIVAGNFTLIQGVPVTNVARRTAEGWQQMGSLHGVTDLFNRDGTLYAAGRFEGHVARWTGEQWVIADPAPTSPDLARSSQFTLTEHNGSLLLAHYGSLSQFLLLDGSEWRALPGFYTNRTIAQVASADGRIYSGGAWDNLLRVFDGVQWVDVRDSDGNRIRATALESHNGDLYVCYLKNTSTTEPWTIAYLNGDSFVPVGNLSRAIRKLHSAANGDLYAISELPVVYRVRDNALTALISGIGTEQYSGFHNSDIASDPYGDLALIRYRYPSGNTFAEFLDPRPVALRDVPAEMPVCDNGRAEVSVRVLGTLDRTLRWEWDGGGEFAPIADGFVAGLGIVGGSASDALLLDQADVAAFGTHVRLVASDACNAATSAAIMLVPGASDTYACARCSSCPNDYNQDGSTDGADLAAFFADFELGLPCADIDRDGGVSGADIGAFFAAFETGAC